LPFVPFRNLPPWFKWQTLRTTVVDKLEYWWQLASDAAETVWNALRRRR
jgi:hypothetical protein